MRYLQRISGPLLDRLDLHVQVPPVPVESLAGRPGTEAAHSNHRRASVLDARATQKARAPKEGLQTETNSGLSLRELERVAPLEKGASELVQLAVQGGRLSARGYVRVMRVARTIADLEGSSAIQSSHLGEALRYRVTDLAQL